MTPVEEALNGSGGPVIRITNLSMSYPGGARALFPLDLEFNSGQFTVLLGPSGAGKSTLLRCLNLLIEPSSGRIVTANLGELKDRKKMRRHRRSTGMIFQQHQLISRYTALDNVLIGRIGYYGAWRSLFPLPRRDKAFALACLERVGLLDKALIRVDRLSGGEQQRVGIARALAQEPKVVLADEPVASLDPATAQQVLSLLHRICKDENIAAVVSLHQVHFARSYADRIVGLTQGRVVFDGPPDALAQAALERIYAAKAGTAATHDVKEAGVGAGLPLPPILPLQPSS
jgi:phosphonate transport system ATP-binding protein